MPKNSTCIRILRRVIGGMLLLMSFGNISLQAQPQLTDEGYISILTEAAGEQIFNAFGHTAVRIKDDSLGIDHVYNYGVYDFNTDNFVLKFLRGKLLYTMTITPFERFMQGPRYQKRALSEQILNLETAEKNKLLSILVESSEPQNREYLYDFYFNNCATKVIDFIDEATDGDYHFRPTEPIPKKTFRELLHEHTVGRDWTTFGMDLVLGTLSDRYTTLREQTFLPEYLRQNIAFYKSDAGVSMLREDRVLLDLPPLTQKSFWITPLVLFSFLLIVELLVGISSLYDKTASYSKWLRMYDKASFILVFIASLILLFMWFFTDHQTCANNYNLLYINPLFGLLLFIKNKKIGAVISAVIMLCLILVILTFIPQAISFPMQILALILLLKTLRWSRFKYQFLESWNKNQNIT